MSFSPKQDFDPPAAMPTSLTHGTEGPEQLKVPKKLVLCFDGTGNSFNDENTNVVRLFSVLDKDRTDKQLCYYQPGIGTAFFVASHPY